MKVGTKRHRKTPFSFDIIILAKSENITYYRGLAGLKFLQGFSYARRKVNECQGNRSGPAPIPAAHVLQTVASARIMPKRKPDVTRNMIVIPRPSVATAEPGSASVTAMLLPIRCVRFVLRRVSTHQPSRSTT